MGRQWGEGGGPGRIWTRGGGGWRRRLWRRSLLISTRGLRLNEFHLLISKGVILVSFVFPTACCPVGIYTQTFKGEGTGPSSSIGLYRPIDPKKEKQGIHVLAELGSMYSTRGLCPPDYRIGLLFICFGEWLFESYSK